MDEESPPPIRLMNFVSQDQLDKAKKTRGERVEDGTAQRDRPLYEILKENKDRKDAEFNERLKHRPPKALDEDETEFLDKLEMTRREYDRQVADEEAQQLKSFQAAVAARSSIVYEMKETPNTLKVEEQKVIGKKEQKVRPLGGLIVTVKPQAKKAKTESPRLEEMKTETETPKLLETKPSGSTKGTLGLVSYEDDDESEENDS